jgi:NADPH:quinone reductase-like Zn-dependent oxidoreductase
MTRRGVAMVERSEPFRAFRIEEDEEGEGPKGRMVDIGLSDLNEGELVIGTRYSNLNYKDALAATGKGKIARRLPIVGGIDVAGTVEASENPAFEPGTRCSSPASASRRTATAGTRRSRGSRRGTP